MPAPKKIKEIKVSSNFNKNILSANDQKTYDFTLKRIMQLQEARKDHYKQNLETVWNDADKDYVPHRLNTVGKKVVATDEDKGWRGSLVRLGADNWQSDIYKPNPYIKIQTALSILVDKNPSGVFTAGSKKHEASTQLMSQLYSRNWEVAKSKQQLKLFIFNLAKYGWAIGRTYPLKLERTVKSIVEFNEDNPQKSIYEEKEVTEYNDVFRENLDPWNCWIDDMARPNNKFSKRDWAWRKVYAYDAAEEEFGKYPNWKYVKPNEGGVVTEKVNATNTIEKGFKEENLVEVYFYENRLKDLYVVLANNVPIIIDPLPISDANGLKQLSCWETYWTLRHAESPYGIGVYESIRFDQAMLDRIRNMTIDQLTLSIYKSFFYQGTESLLDTGQIKITPGVGKQVINPKDINWLQVPGPGADAYKGIEMFREDIDDASGITPTLMGDVTGKTAFEVSQAKESALKRLKNPLDNICEALETDGYITVSLIQLLYSIPETYSIADPALIEAYLKDVESDPELFERDQAGGFNAKVYREFPLNLEKDEKDNLIETEETRFFRIKPSFLAWDGVIVIKPQSILTPSKQLDKALDLEMYNMLIPLLAQPPELYAKIAKNIVKLYEKDPREVLPDIWLADNKPVDQPLVVPLNSAVQSQVQTKQNEQQMMDEQMNQGKSKAQATAMTPTQNPSIAKQILSKMTNPLRKT